MTPPRGAFLALGVAVGVAVGAAMRNLGAGIAVASRSGCWRVASPTGAEAADV